MHASFIAAASGIAAAAAGASPTGSPVVDFMLVAAFAALVTWSSATAPWWAVGLACAIAAVVAVQPLLVAVALAGWAATFFIGIRRRNLPLVRVAAAAAAVQVFARLQLDGFLGLSAIIGCVTLAALFVPAMLRRERAVRKRVWKYLGIVVACAALALVGLALSALAARGPLQEGNRRVHDGLDALNRGDMAAAASAFGAASSSFRSADNDLSALWAQPSRLLPVVAQHRASAITLASTAAHAMDLAAGALRQIDPESLRVVKGQIDLDAVRGLVAPFTSLQTAIAGVGAALADADSQWLTPMVRTRLHEFEDDMAKNKVRADNAVLAAQLAPAMLGADGTRRYFVAFTTPAEARGLGGFMGNWAEMTIENGHISMSEFGRHTDLSNGGPDPGNRRLNGPAEFIDRWGRFGFYDPADGTTAVQAWSNITMPPDFAMVGDVIAQLYPQSGGRKIDGAFALDPQTMAALVSFTGAITLDGVDEPLTAANTANFIIRDQYNITQLDDRVDLLDTIARTVVDRLLGGSMPEPAELARTLGPLTRQGRLMGWSADPAEESLFAKIGMSGAFPALDGGDGVAVVVDNAAGNKADAFLDVATSYRIGTLDASGFRDGTVTITLTNNAPAGGLPDYVLANAVDLPLGTNRMFLSVYTGLAMESVTVDGEPSTMETGTSLGWNVASTFLNIPPGGTRVVTLQVAGVLASPERELVTRDQPIVRVQPVVVSRD